MKKLDNFGNEVNRKETTECRMCGRGICKPRVFCTQNCEDHYNQGFKLEYNYENFYKAAGWRVLVGNESLRPGDIYFG